MPECFYCEKKKGSTKDHVRPKSKGGSDAKGNIVMACSRCNGHKGSKSLEEFISYVSTCEYFIKRQIDLKIIENCKRLLLVRETWDFEAFYVCKKQFDFCSDTTTDVPDRIRIRIIDSYNNGLPVERKILHELKELMIRDAFFLANNF